MPAREPGYKPVRATLSEQVQDWADGERIKRMLDEIEGLEKQAWVNCPHCKKRSQISVSDDVRKLEALLKVIESVEGRPGTADAEPAGVTIIVERKWPEAEFLLRAARETLGDHSHSEQLRAVADAGGVPPQ